MTIESEVSKKGGIMSAIDDFFIAGNMTLTFRFCLKKTRKQRLMLAI